jgi:hypothetical protein
LLATAPARRGTSSGFNSDVGHYFVEVIEIGPELTDGP